MHVVLSLTLKIRLIIRVFFPDWKILTSNTYIKYYTLIFQPKNGDLVKLTPQAKRELKEVLVNLPPRAKREAYETRDSQAESSSINPASSMISNTSLMNHCYQYFQVKKSRADTSSSILNARIFPHVLSRICHPMHKDLWLFQLWIKAVIAEISLSVAFLSRDKNHVPNFDQEPLQFWIVS